MSALSVGALGRLLLPGVIGWGLTGCATRQPATEFFAHSTQRAVVRWQQDDRAIRGDVDFSRDGQGAVLMEWNDSGGPSHLRILLTPDANLFVSGALADRSWSGSVNDAPRGLSTWTSFLLAYQHAADLPIGRREIHAPTHRMAYEKSSRGLLSLSIASTGVRESLSAIFQPPHASGSHRNVAAESHAGNEADQ